MAKPRPPLAAPVVPAADQQLLAQAMQLLQVGMTAQARAALQQVVQRNPRHADAHGLLGMIAARSGEFERAAFHFGESLATQPANPAGWNNHGVALRKLGRDAEAAQSFERAVKLRADYGEAHFNLGNAVRELGRLEAAVASYGRALALQPDRLDAWVNQGLALVQLRRHADALASFDAAIALRPDDARAHLNRGGVLMEANRPDEAIASFDRAIELDPSLADAYENRAQASARAKRHLETVTCYERLYALDPSYPYVVGNLLHARMLVCDWRGIEELHAEIRNGLAAGARVAEPFGYQGIAESEVDLLACARIYAQAEYPPVPAPEQPPAARDESRIIIGYLCGEFRQHATTMLMCGVYETHRKDRFRLIALDNGGADDSDWRRRVEAAFDELVDIRGLGDDAVAALVRERGIDVLVNLNGYYGDGRMGVFARRAAPVQVNYLGFPGTLGAPYFDYLIADSVVLPAGSREAYTEKIAWLPHCYQANDDRRAIAAVAPPRKAAGLPAEAFVYCCFNNNYKITPRTFDGWMRILQRVPSSVLWLLEDNPAAAANLRGHARDRGIDPDRLVFAQRLPPAEHLARHALADLFVDTLPYNAHTTASDALWAGLPLLTCRGTTFPGRVGASLLQALGLGDLVTDDAEAFEALAVELAGDRPRLARLREQLASARLERPPFDTAATTAALESLYEAMVDRARRGLPPDHLGV
jgi:predicted O-linked N-acetylglucosamine transferase (SPINDLY family)